MTADFLYLVLGGGLLLAVLLPTLVHRYAVSAPMVLLLVGMVLGLLPYPDDIKLSPSDHPVFLEHLTELAVIVALMGVGLALDRPLELRRLRTWLRWGATWRLLAVAMPLSIAAVAFVGWWAVGLAPASALLLGAALAPTDPVLASDVQVEGPTASDDEPDEIDEDDEVRFALTSEAGLNDALAFPFVYAAILLASVGVPAEWLAGWLAWEVVGKIVLGAVVGVVLGWGLARLAFRAPAPSLRLAETGEPLLALAAVLLSYGAAEAIGGYGFLAVFACALALRSAERGHEYHVHMHQTVERLERLLTLVVLLLLGAALTGPLADDLSWGSFVVAASLVLVVRPLSGIVALRLGRARTPGSHVGARRLRGQQEWAIAFFGVRGVGTLYYLAYAANQTEFAGMDAVWAVAGVTIALSVLVHGVTATPVMRHLEECQKTVG